MAPCKIDKSGLLILNQTFPGLLLDVDSCWESLFFLLSHWRNWSHAWMWCSLVCMEDQLLPHIHHHRLSKYSLLLASHCSLFWIYIYFFPLPPVTNEPLWVRDWHLSASGNSRKTVGLSTEESHGTDHLSGGHAGPINKANLSVSPSLCGFWACMSAFPRTVAGDTKTCLHYGSDS